MDKIWEKIEEKRFFLYSLKIVMNIKRVCKIKNKERERESKDKTYKLRPIFFSCGHEKPHQSSLKDSVQRRGVSILTTFEIFT